MIIKPRYLATGIGSMPFDDPGRAIDLILFPAAGGPPLAAIAQAGPQ